MGIDVFTPESGCTVLPNSRTRREHPLWINLRVYFYWDLMGNFGSIQVSLHVVPKCEVLPS
jgi:hypothetical protein